MAKGEVIINEMTCQGCGYCAVACAKDCFRYPSDKLTVLGLPIPEFANVEKCNACGACAWLCPGYAIEVYKFVDDKEPAGERQA